MSDIGRLQLFGKLDPLLYETLQGATAFCKLRGNLYVELAHWLHQLVHRSDGDLVRIVRHFGLEPARLEADLVAALDALPAGASAVADLSAHIDHAVERAWVLASLRWGAPRIRGGHLAAALLGTHALRTLVLAISPQFGRVSHDALLGEFDAILGGSVEDAPAAVPVASGAGDADAPLARYTVDLTAQARSGALDPVAGRAAEIRQLVDILLRRRQNNPLLTGEAGVGKTAVVEGLALRIASGDVPPPLRDVALHLLDLGLLQAGASMKGEFEARLRALVDAVQASPRPVILFIDEIHTLVGAGGAAGTGDAANLLKPALARGQLRTIGATTWSEYKQYIEKDPALTRRFQVVQVHEPQPADALVMLRGLAGRLSAHHGVLVLDEAIEAAVSLSRRYIPARQLPDKGVALLDTACARVAVSQHTVPPALEDARRAIEALREEEAVLEREAALAIGDSARLGGVATALAGHAEAERGLLARWEEERVHAGRIRALGEAIAAETDAAARTGLQDELRAARAALAGVQGEAPLVLPAVDANAVAAVVAEWTGIPVGRMLRDEARAVLELADTLAARVVGQRPALETIARRIQGARAGLTAPDKPVGVFLLCGPSGVGKTETALALADALYGGEQSLVTINLSEFQEAHTVSTLKGAPPGYVGYGRGGVLTEAVRRRPHGVLLLDEVEKAHPDVHEIFFQVFDKGWMEDGEGRRIDFRDTVILLTSNVGAERIAALTADPELVPDAEALAGALREPLRQVFPAALLGRLTVVPYYPLDDAALASVIALQIDRVAARLAERHGIALDVDASARALIAARCTEVESGGRMVEAVLNGAVLPPISHAILAGTVGGRTPRSVRVRAEAGGFDVAFA